MADQRQGGVAFAVAYCVRSYRESSQSDVGGLSCRLIGAITALLILLSAVAVVLVRVAAGG